MARKGVKRRKARPSRTKGGTKAARGARAGGGAGRDSIGKVLVDVGTLLVQLGALLQSDRRPAAPPPGKAGPERHRAIRDVLDNLRVTAKNCDPDPTCTVECGSARE